MSGSTTKVSKEEIFSSGLKAAASASTGAASRERNRKGKRRRITKEEIDIQGAWGQIVEVIRILKIDVYSMEV